MKVALDVSTCTGHGRCYALAPDVFGPDDMGRCEVLQAEPEPEQRESARNAVASCPEEALTIVE